MGQLARGFGRLRQRSTKAVSSAAGRCRIAPIIGIGVLLSSQAIGQISASVQPAAALTGPVPMIGRVWHSHMLTPPTIEQCQQQFGIKCYTPPEIRAAYNLTPLYADGLNGTGRTIAIVDSFGSPTIRSDLSAFDAAFGIQPPPSLEVLQPAGPVPPFDPTNITMTGWASETTLDVEWAHAIAPGARIVLLETPVAETEGVVGVPQMVRAMNFAIDHSLADVISQSWGATEETFSSQELLKDQRSAYVNAQEHGVTVLASSGDNGAASQRFDGTSFFPFRTIGWPASDPLVTAVGGTFLNLNRGGDRLTPDVTAQDGASGITSGSGLSHVFSRPVYQNSVRGIVGDDRGIPDVSMSGACNGAVLVYSTFTGSPSWDPICGTSESSPLFSGIVAISAQRAGHRLGLVNRALYRMLDMPESGIVDVTKGDTTVTVCTAKCSSTTPTMTTVSGFRALDGYDLATGVGTLNGPEFVESLARTAGNN